MNADGIENPLFRSSEQLRRHVFLTGETHCGKSTIIHRVLKELEPNRLIAGFYTFFSHDNIVITADSPVVKKNCTLLHMIITLWQIQKIIICCSLTNQNLLQNGRPSKP